MNKDFAPLLRKKSRLPTLVEGQKAPVNTQTDLHEERGGNTSYLADNEVSKNFSAVSRCKNQTTPPVLQVDFSAVKANLS